MAERETTGYIHFIVAQSPSREGEEGVAVLLGAAERVVDGLSRR